MTRCNENRPGYHKTKVGWIPDTWVCVPFTVLFNRVRLPVSIEPEDTYREIGIRSHCKGVFLKEEVIGRTIGNKRVFWCQPGALVFNIVFAWEQAVAILGPETDGLIASHRFPMYQARSGCASEVFYLWFFSSRRGKHGLALASPGGAGRNKTLGQGELEFLFLPAPPLPEQERITKVLSAWYRAIALADRLIDAKQRLKKGLMQQLITGRMRFSEFGNPVRTSGELPSGWTLGPIGRAVQVNAPRPIRRGQTVSFIDMASVDTESGDITRTSRKNYIGSGSKFQNGDTVFARITPCAENGKIAFIDCLDGNEIAAGSTEFTVLSPVKTITDPRFVFYLARSHKVHAYAISKMEGTSGRQRVPNWVFSDPSVMIPPLHEQHYIADFLAYCDQEVSLLRQRESALRKQKQGLMKTLLTGEIRVPPPTDDSPSDDKLKEGALP